MNKQRDISANEATGKGVARAAVERKDAAQAIAAISLRKDRQLAIRGKDKPITDEMREEALIMLANGVPMDRVTEHFGIDRSSLLIIGDRIPGFGERVREAMSMGTVSIVNDLMRTAGGEEGYTTGSIERDKLVCDLGMRYAKTIGNRIFGDKLQVDQRSISITVAKDDVDW